MFTGSFICKWGDEVAIASSLDELWSVGERNLLPLGPLQSPDQSL